jgi:hypothetical protein
LWTLAWSPVVPIRPCNAVCTSEMTMVLYRQIACSSSLWRHSSWCLANVNSCLLVDPR